jgi:tRNA-dihydrouridine synthase A
MLSHRFCIAPMLDWTDRHCRFFLRQISRHVLLYTEMVTTGAILHGPRERLLGFNREEHPLALQLGGSDPDEMAQCARIAEEAGFDEVNINVGCPSDRVQNGAFGACLMASPQVVADCVAAMRTAVDIPVTVKTRIGIDDQDSYSALETFAGTLAASGCRTFIVHARKAWLQGLSPKENREIPPLDYERVYRLKADHPEFEIVINGGITSLEVAEHHLRFVDGVMMGREAYHNPFVLADVDRRFYGVPFAFKSREDVLDAMLPYIEREMAQGTAFKHIARHLLGLYHGQPGGRLWRRTLSERAHLPEAGIALIQEALSKIKEVQAVA